MSETKIMFHDAEEVEEFVSAAAKCDFDIDIFYNRIIIDAKSILGVLSMDLRHALTVKCHGSNRDFDRMLRRFAVA